jgi:hypothetical protein
LDYIASGYEVLHTQSIEYVVEQIIFYIKSRK